MTGIAVVELPAAALNYSIFNTNADGPISGGFAAIVQPNGTMHVNKADIAAIGQTVKAVKLGTGISVVAWSYNNVSGKLRVAIDGTLETFTSAQTLVHGTVERNGYYPSPNTTYSNPHKQYLFALSASDAVADAQLREWSINPYVIFSDEPDRRLWAVSSGGTDYTLTADSALFALTGTAANLEYHRLLAATQGSFAVNATAATLKIGRALQADSASFALSGTDAGLRLDKVLQAGSASSQVTGTDASLEYNRVLSAESASFQIVGTDATFIHDAPGSYTLSAEPASFGISAQPATLKYNRRLSVDSAAFAFSGTAASLRYARAVIAEAAAFALTGTDATFIRTGGPEPIVSTVERAAIFRAAVERAATFQRNKQVNVRFN